MIYFYTKGYIEDMFGVDYEEYIHNSEVADLSADALLSIIAGQIMRDGLLEDMVFQVKDNGLAENLGELAAKVEAAAGEEDLGFEQNNQGFDGVIEGLYEQGLLDVQSSPPLEQSLSHQRSGAGAFVHAPIFIRLAEGLEKDSETLAAKLGGLVVTDPAFENTEISYMSSTLSAFNITTSDVVVNVVNVSEKTLNVSPDAYDDFFLSTVNTLVSGNVFDDNGYGADLDIDGGTISTVTEVLFMASGGRVDISSDGDFTYTPAANYSGVDKFSYSVVDLQGGSDSADVRIHVSSGDVATAVDFSVATITGYGVDQNMSNLYYVENEGETLHLEGNTWKDIALSYTVTADTVLEFDFMSTSRGEIHGIGFDTEEEISSPLTFKVFGSQSWGESTYNIYAGNEGDWVHFKIDVGDFYTGSFSRLFFVNDDDASTNANSFFSNVVIYELGTSASETMTGSGGTQTFMGLGGDDVIYGLDGDDVLYGGSGIDYLYGGAGADTFGFDDVNDVDHIQDFDIAEGDMIDVADLLSGYDPVTDAIADFVAVTSEGNDTIISIDGDGGADSFVQIAIVHGVSNLADVDALEAGGVLVAI